MEEEARRCVNKGAATWVDSAVEESPDATTFSGAVKDKFASMFGAVALGLRNTFSDYSSGLMLGGHLSMPGESYSERDARLREVYMTLLGELSSLARAELQPGQRRDAMRWLKELSAKEEDVFLEAFERVFHTETKKITDRARSSALRFSGDFVDASHKAEHIAFLINCLNSPSPSQASAAAVSLGEIADTYTAPAIAAAMDRVVWPSVRQDLSETLDEIKGHD